MSVCEKCWAEAGGNAEKYLEVLKKNEKNHPLDAAQTEPTSAAVDYLLRVVSGYAGTIKNLGQVTLDSTDLPFLESIRSLILSAPSLLDAHEGPTSGERDAMLQWFDTWTNSEHVSDWSVKRKMDGSDAMKAIRSLILSGPAPRVVSREWVVGVFDDLEDYHGEPAYEYLERRLRSIGVEVSE